MKRINVTGLVLLTAGIAIGIALTMISMHAVGVATPKTHTATDSQHKLIAEKAPPGAANAQTSPPDAQAQSEETEQVSAAPQAPADWLKPQDLSAQNGTGTDGGAASSAVPAAPQYQSSHTEYYIYPTGPTGPVSYPTNMATPESGFLQPATPVMIGQNGLIQNPCVDPPSVRRRAYRH